MRSVFTTFYLLLRILPWCRTQKLNVYNACLLKDISVIFTRKCSSLWSFGQVPTLRFVVFNFFLSNSKWFLVMCFPLKLYKNVHFECSLFNVCKMSNFFPPKCSFNVQRPVRNIFPWFFFKFKSFLDVYSFFFLFFAMPEAPLV